MHNPASVTHLNIPLLIFPTANITKAIISIHIATPINYRMSVPVRSDFYVIAQFPEVYHGQGITTPPVYGGERVIAG